MKSSLECIQMAWAWVLRDFRQWCKAEGKAMYAWKTAPIQKAIFACRSNMIDDSEAMLKAWAKDETAFIPVMTTAIAPIQSPPDYEQVVGFSDWTMGVVPSDPLQRVVQFRTVPSAFRCQIAFFCPDTHGAKAVADQFCAYFRSEKKRTFGVAFDVGVANDEVITDTWNFRVLENSLFPDTAMSDYKNLTIVTVDCTIIGDIPTVVGLGGKWDDETDTGEKKTPDEWKNSKNPIFKPISGGSNVDNLGKVVVEAHTHDENSDKKVIVTVDNP